MTVIVPIDSSRRGFPCRAFGCHEAFVPSQADSFVQLLAASARRTEHELTVHGLAPAAAGSGRLRPVAAHQYPDDVA